MCTLSDLFRFLSFRFDRFTFLFAPALFIVGIGVSLTACGYQWTHQPLSIHQSTIKIQGQNRGSLLHMRVYRLIQQKWSILHQKKCPPPLYFTFHSSQALPLGDQETTSSFYKVSFSYYPSLDSTYSTGSNKYLRSTLRHTFETQSLHHHTHPSFFPTSPSQLQEEALPSLIDQFLFFCSSATKN